MSVTIVLAVQGAAHLVAPWLHRLGGDPPAGLDILLTYADGDHAAQAACEALARDWARPLAAPRRALIPGLWAAGIRASSADRVALSVVHCQPTEGWMQALSRADLTDHSAVGGPIEQAAGSDAIGWAIYLQRYTPFTASVMQDVPSDRREIAGDNALYDRASLLQVASVWESGFWELDVHAALRDAGRTLGYEPRMEVEHHNGYSPWGFVEQRLRHGFVFGAARAAACSGPRRAAYRALAPTIPALFGAKVVRRALGHPPARGRLLAASPWLLLFVLAWSLGEGLGAYGGAR